ncbi:unnamed protein product [Protopolystoma xenopodis]|uniref:Uncharacterized protein n=1 Tax=Protopolystoma xenopodis TaxID=117903 RepID=A0A3S5CUJ7_9PLAT|nr:unnamed protein product [Protopolystoma xenopodis]
MLTCPSRSLRQLIASLLLHGAAILSSPASSSFSNSERHSNTSGLCEGQVTTCQSISVDCNVVSPPRADPDRATLGGPGVWAACLPQLLVRLAHPDPGLRHCITGLLMRLIGVYPDALVNTPSTPSVSAAASRNNPQDALLDIARESVALRRQRFADRLVFPAVVAMRTSPNLAISESKNGAVHKETMRSVS